MSAGIRSAPVFTTRNTNHTAAHKCIKLSCYNSERGHQETSCLYWWNVSGLSIDDVLILQLDVGVDLMANVQWKLFNKVSRANQTFFQPLNPKLTSKPQKSTMRLRQQPNKMLPGICLFFWITHVIVPEGFLPWCNQFLYRHLVHLGLYLIVKACTLKSLISICDLMLYISDS